MTGSDGLQHRFGDIELDVASRELRRAGTLVAVEPRVFDLLVYLINERHRAVDKDDIQAAIWRGTIVSETALTRAIMKARRAVGDAADRQNVIRTVHGHGYQFVATLDEPRPVANDADTAAALPTARRHWTVVALAAGLAAAAVLLAFWVREPQSGPIRLAVLPIENATGDSELDWTELGLMGLVSELLGDDGRFGVVPAAALRPLLDSPPTDADEGRSERLRRALGSNTLLNSRLTRSAGLLQLTYTLELPNGRRRTATMVGSEPAGLAREMANSIARELAPDTSDAAETYVISDDPFINEAYSRALGLSLEGRCADALPLFEVVRAGAADRLQVRFEWAHCASILGRTDAAEAAFEALLASTADGAPTPARVRALHGLGVLLHRTGRREQAAKRYAEALAAAKSRDDWAQQGRVLNSMALEARDRGANDEARELIGLSFVAHRTAGVEIMPGQPYAALANIDMAEGRLDDADAHLDKALASFRELGDRRNEAMMLNNRGYLRRLQGRAAAAEPLQRQALAIRREIGDVMGQGRILGMLSVLYTEQGRLDEAGEAAAEAYRIAAASDDRLFMATALAQLGDVARARDNLDAAHERYTASQRHFEAIGDEARAAQAALLIVRVDAARGDAANAAERATAIRVARLAKQDFQTAIEALELEGDLARDRDDPTAAVAAYEQALDVIGLSDFVGRRMPIIEKLVALHLDRGDLAAAQPLVGVLIEREATVEGLLLEARYHSLGGAHERARERLGAARALAGERWTDEHEARRAAIVATTESG